jgi:hypothetical protein
MERMIELLEKAADRLDEGEDPFHNKFLTENDVTLNEVYTLAAFMAIGTRMMVFSMKNPKAALAMANAGKHSVLTDVLEELNKRARNQS